jgi:DNA-binding NtrC family response regulator
MAYSGADVLAHLSELARQRAQIRRVADAVVIAPQPQEGEIIQSALRGVMGYDARITIVQMIGDAAKLTQSKPPEVVFVLDPSTTEAAGPSTLRALRSAGVQSPVAIISDQLTLKTAAEILAAVLSVN